MKHFFLFISILFSLGLTAQTEEVLTNQIVVELYRLGLGEDVMVNKIKTTKNTFDVTINGLIQLKKDSMPQSIISAMIETAQKSKTEALQNSNDPLDNHTPGIYWYKEKKTLVQLNPTNATSSNTNTAAMVFSYGLAKAKTKTQVPGLTARTKINETSPVFYFYIPESDLNTNSSLTNLSLSSSFFATSPNDFIVISFTLNDKQNSREVVSGSFNAYSRQSGVDNTKTMPFSFIKKGKGIYEVKFDQPISAGEYAFMFSNNTINKVYDFSIGN